MSDNCRFVVAIHALAYMAHHSKQTCSSERIADSVQTNPVVIRRLMLQLREARLIKAIAGRCGGFKLNTDPENISLDKIYLAVEIGPLISNPIQTGHPDCPIAKKIHNVMNDVLSDAQKRYLIHLSHINLQNVINELNIERNQT